MRTSRPKWNYKPHRVRYGVALAIKRVASRDSKRRSELRKRSIIYLLGLVERLWPLKRKKVQKTRRRERGKG